MKTSRTRFVPLVLLLLAVLLIGICASLVSCGVPPVPTAPNAEPLQMGRVDDEINFRWCGADSEVFQFIRIDYVSYGVARVEGPVAVGGGSFSFAAGDEFSSTTPPDGATFSLSEPIAISDVPARVFVYVGQSEDVIDSYMIFEPGSLTSLKTGEWLSTSGEKTPLPCEASITPSAERK